jgi:hypothetical protein
MQAFPVETYGRINDFLDVGSQGAMRLTCFSNFRHCKYAPGHIYFLNLGSGSFQAFCEDVAKFKETGRLNLSVGYAGLESMSVPIRTMNDFNWDQANRVMLWIKPKILAVESFLLNAPSCWERLGYLLTDGCKVLRLEHKDPAGYVAAAGRRAVRVVPRNSETTDIINPYSLFTATTKELSVLQKAPNIHHLSIRLPPWPFIHARGHGRHAHDSEMSFIGQLGMPKLTSLLIAREDENADEYYEYFRGWACYWTVEEDGVWRRLARGRAAYAIDELTSEMEASRCEWIYDKRMTLSQWLFEIDKDSDSECSSYDSDYSTDSQNER